MTRLSVMLWVAGCSTVERINGSAAGIEGEARTLVEHGTAVRDPVVVDGATRIIEMAQGIRADIVHVRDAVPAWVSTLWMLGVAAAAIAVAIILWQTGIGQAIRAAVGWIPRATRRRAELAADMMDPARPETGREFVAAQRASDPLFDRAFTQARKRQETHTPCTSPPSSPSSAPSGSASSSAP